LVLSDAGNLALNAEPRDSSEQGLATNIGPQPANTTTAQLRPPAQLVDVNMPSPLTRQGAMKPNLPSPSRFARQGFSLLEVLIVVIILAIAAVVAAPLVGQDDDSRLRAAASLLMADLGYAQVESISRPDDPCVVVFDTPNKKYHVARASASATPITNPSDGKPYTVQFGSGRAAELGRVSIQGYSLGGDAILGFGAYGQPDQSTTATITLQSGTSTLTVQVSAPSGETSTGS
jgi:prepilin-type N-terminal cleavage/methylation domain-containing protein